MHNYFLLLLQLASITGSSVVKMGSAFFNKKLNCLGVSVGSNQDGSNTAVFFTGKENLQNGSILYFVNKPLSLAGLNFKLFGKVINPVQN